MSNELKNIEKSLSQIVKELHELNRQLRENAESGKASEKEEVQKFVLFDFDQWLKTEKLPISEIKGFLDVAKTKGYHILVRNIGPYHEYESFLQDYRVPFDMISRSSCFTPRSCFTKTQEFYEGVIQVYEK